MNLIERLFPAIREATLMNAQLRAICADEDEVDKYRRWAQNFSRALGKPMPPLVSILVQIRCIGRLKRDEYIQLVEYGLHIAPQIRQIHNIGEGRSLDHVFESGLSIPDLERCLAMLSTRWGLEE